MSRYTRHKSFGRTPNISSFPITHTVSLGTRTYIVVMTALLAVFILPAGTGATEQDDDDRSLTLTTAMSLAVERNLDLNSAQYTPQLARDEKQIARASLLPQGSIGATRRQIDRDRGNPMRGAERSTNIFVSGSQSIYSERSWSAFRIAEFLHSSADHEFTVVVLDTVRSAATAFLNTMRSAAIVNVRRSNVEVTEKNLELSELRERVGFSGRADVLRWESQIALDRQALLAAEAQRKRFESELLRLLHLPMSQSPVLHRDGIDQILDSFEKGPFKDIIDTEHGWSTVLEFMVAEAISNSPEIKQIDELIQAGHRRLLASRRAFYLPDLSVEGDSRQTADRGGNGANLSNTGLDNDEWSIMLTASLPIFTGGRLRAERTKAEHELLQLMSERDALTEKIETATRSAVFQIESSLGSIALARAAATAADENRELITKAYSRGAVSIIDLVDAQDAALTGALSAAEAEYAFLLDLIELFRAAGNFAIFLESEAPEQWLKRLAAFTKKI